MAPYNNIVRWLSILFIIGCGLILSDQTYSEDLAGIPQLNQSLQSTEEQGTLPKLDRSSDVKGPDTDSNGIRDDVSTYIDRLQITVDQKVGANALAKAVQGTLLVDTNDSTALRQATTDLSRAIQCMSIKFPNINQRLSVMDGIEEITVNTKERSLQYIRFNNSLSGTVTKLLSGDTC